MALVSRDIQRRLTSVRNVKKITRAMELVAASKMRKSVARVVQSRAYAQSAWQMVMNLIPKTDPAHHPLLSERPVKSVAIVVMSSNRGLCGAFNLNVVHAAIGLVRKERWDQGARVDFITFGKKGAQILTVLGKPVVADYPKDDSTDTIAHILPISDSIMKGFIGKKYDEVCLAYTDFQSSLVQKARIRHLLPLVKPSRFLGMIGEKQENQKVDFSEFLFEPSPDIVLDALLVRLIEVQVYQAVLESEASEHSARMMAMHNATDAASDMLETLTLAYNQARQAAITAELAEITAATVAVQ